MLSDSGETWAWRMRVMTNTVLAVLEYLGQSYWHNEWFGMVLTDDEIR
jgi:hypothetical protein